MKILASMVAMALVALLLPGSAAAGKYVEVKGAKAPGPDEFDRVFIEKHGPRKAGAILVMIPGTGGGAGSIAQTSKDLAKRVDNLQVWGFDRREQAFEDTSGFDGRDPDAAADYYLGFQYDRVLAEDVPFVSKWGFRVEMNDLRKVIRKAGKGGRQVFLGGHSRGASSAVAYATWDFNGKPGYKSIDGLFLVDGGLAAFGPQDFTLAQAQEGLLEIRDGKLFNDPLGAGIPEIGPIFSELAALYADERPDELSALQDNPIIPASLKPPFPVTNEAFLGYVFDANTSPPGFDALRIRAGGLAPNGEPRPWVSGENTPIESFAETFSREPANATEWYYPRRMVLDTAAANALRPTRASAFLGLKIQHTEDVDVPLYAIQTDLTSGGVLAGAKVLIQSSEIKRTRLIDAANGMSHLDPVVAPAATNRFTKSAAKFLQRLVKAPSAPSGRGCNDTQVNEASNSGEQLSCAVRP